MPNTIHIVEKPEWVSWDEIKQCLMESHDGNRDKGLTMGHVLWPAEKIKDFVGKNGVMFVALDGQKVVGTAAIIERYGHSWYASGRYAFLGFAGVLPEYKGRGIYRELLIKREDYAKKEGFRVMVLDTHEKNNRLQRIAKTNGFKYVSYFLVSNRDHFNVVMAKWLERRPFINLICCCLFLLSKVKAKVINRRLL